MKTIKFFLILMTTLVFSTLGNFAYAQYNNNHAEQKSTNGTVQTSNQIDHSVSTTQTTTDTMNAEKVSKMDLKTSMRKLWEDHIWYTRNFVISAVANLNDTDAVTKRLLKNQDDIGDAIKPFYGDDAGNKLSKLLREHILIAAKVVDAAKTNNKKALEKAQKEWTANADDIATFLSAANPSWTKEELMVHLQKHLDLVTEETSARLKKDWQTDIKVNDENHDHMLMFSDTLVDGIAKQFSDKVQM